MTLPKQEDGSIVEMVLEALSGGAASMGCLRDATRAAWTSRACRTG